MCCETVLPVVGDVASFYDEVLMVFNCGFDDLGNKRPHPVAHLPVVIDGERRHAAADESHLEVVERDIREAKPCHESLRHQRLSNMAAATKKYNHMHLRIRPPKWTRFAGIIPVWLSFAKNYSLFVILKSSQLTVLHSNDLFIKQY